MAGNMKKFNEQIAEWIGCKIKGRLVRLAWLHLQFLTHEWWVSYWWCPGGNRQSIFRGGIGLFLFSFGTQKLYFRFDLLRKPRLSLKRKDYLQSDAVNGCIVARWRYR